MTNEQQDHQNDRSSQADGLTQPPQKGGKGKFLLIALGLLIVLAVLAVFGITGAVGRHRERDKTAQSVDAGAATVRVTKPSKSPPVLDFSLPGSSEPLITATLYARVNGYLKARYVDIGDRVEAGQLLAEIDAPDLDAQVNASRAQLEQSRAALGIAKVTYEREKRLLEQKVVSKQEYDQSEASYNQAIANVKTAEANVQNLSVQQGFEKITAPFTGTVTTRFLDDGALIASGSATTTPSIFTLSQSDILRIFIYVPQAYSPNVQTGQEVEVSLPEYPQKIFKGKVTRTADALDPTARTERVEVQLPSDQGRLLPGMYLTVRFKVQQAEPALIVPSNTVEIRKEGPRVAVIDGEQKVRYREVKLGRDFGKTIEIVSGLQGNESIVINPTTDLVDGAKVDVAPEERKAREFAGQGGAEGVRAFSLVTARGGAYAARPLFQHMSDQADEKNAAEDPAAANGPHHTEGKPMTELERIRHSAAHILATAILRIWPEAQFAAGPPVENGFYYDVELPHRITPEDFPRIEAEMKKETKANNVFQRVEVSRDEAVALAEKGALASLGERPGSESKFKLDIVRNIPADEKITLYRNGDFTDLCAGPHVGRTGNVGAFKLTHVASAYYKGDEKNPQLQRIYGTAFKNRTQLDEYFAMLEESKKRDHRKLGKELELFCFDEDVGPGLPLWLPRGTAIIEELEKLAKETEFAAGYERVRTPHLARENMYLTSGHLPYYADSMFPPMSLDEYADKRVYLNSLRSDLWTEIAGRAARIGRARHIGEDNIGIWTEQFIREEDELGTLPSELSEAMSKFRAANRQLRELPRPETYYLKAMNCPHHHKLFGAVPRSYRDLPLRLAEYGTCYRYEQSGELQGLMRVRAMQMNDAHIYCTEAQFESEFNAVNQMYVNYFKLFGFSKYQMRFSTHDPAKLGEKFVDDPANWAKTEAMVRKVLQQSGINYIEVPNEAAFYGPKIDVQIWSAIGKEFTIATNQVDFAVPSRFGLKYKTRDNTEETPLCIHRAPLGTHERFIGFLIEHYAGNFPLWLSPEQVRVLPIGDEEPLVEYAQGVVSELRAQGVRATLDAGTDPIKAKIASAEQIKVHTMLVIGHRDLEADNVSVRVHGKGNLGAKPRGEVIADLFASIKERRA